MSALHLHLYGRDFCFDCDSHCERDSGVSNYDPVLSPDLLHPGLSHHDTFHAHNGRDFDCADVCHADNVHPPWCAFYLGLGALGFDFWTC